MSFVIRSFVRRGRVTKTQQAYLENHYNQFTVPETADEFSRLFHEQKIFLDIGPGMGNDLIHACQTYPNILFIAAEPHRPGVGNMLKAIKTLGINNLRLFNDDVYSLLTRIAPQSLSYVRIFYPDPWPKKRNLKRRLVQASFLEKLKLSLKTKAILHCKTDCDLYAQHLNEVFTKDIDFSCEANLTEKLNFIPSKYEKRAIELNHNLHERLAWFIPVNTT